MYQFSLPFQVKSQVAQITRQVRNGVLIFRWLQWATLTSPVFLQKTFGTVKDLQRKKTRITEMYSTSQGVRYSELFKGRNHYW